MNEQGVLFLRKSYCDKDREATISIIDAIATNTGSTAADYLRDRSNLSFWGTLDSTDAANTKIIINHSSEEITDIFIVKNNFGSYNIKLGSSETDANAYDADDVVTNAGISYSNTYSAWGTLTTYDVDDVIYINGILYKCLIAHTSGTFATDLFNKKWKLKDYFHTEHYRIVPESTDTITINILGTQIPNQDKACAQIIICSRLGQFIDYPVIKSAKFNERKNIMKMLSGKSRVIKNLEGFMVELSMKMLTEDDDLELYQTLYSMNEGFLVWLNGGNNTLALRGIKGYREEDIFLMSTSDELENNFHQGIYSSNVSLNMRLIEVVR